MYRVLIVEDEALIRQGLIRSIRWDELKMTLGPLTYSVSILLTFAVSMVVSLLVARKNRKIDMVEALKCAE